MPVYVTCLICGKEFTKSPSQVRERNFCSKNCRLKWLSNYNKTVLNKPGHGKGTKRPHLSEYNRTKNKMNRKESWGIQMRTKSRLRAIKQSESFNKGKSYKKYYGRHLHRVVAESILGRKLTSEEIVHHVDGDIFNNNPENLLIVTREEHAKIHLKNRDDGASK